jgi:O-antigen biosynthesis protein
LSPVAWRRDLSLRGLVARLGDAPQTAEFTPTRVMVVDVEQPLPSIDHGSTPTDEPYQAAKVLVRLHARPLGMLTVDLAAGSVPAPRLQTLIEQRWAGTIRRHLQADGDHRRDIADSGVADDAWNTCLLRPATPPPFVSVVVPTHRRPADLIRCVDSILATQYPQLEVIVVDNAPQEPETAALVTARYSADDRVRYLSEWTPGASRARNRGVRSARGEIIAFADDDVVVERHWIAALTHALVANPDIDCVTGLVIPVALDTAVQLWFEQYGGFNRGYEQRVFDLDDRRGNTLLYPYTAGVLGGLGNAAFRRSALRQPDAFDVTLGPGTPAFGAEDQDAFVALLRAGGRLLYEPAALARHRHREEYADLRWQIFTYGAGLAAALVHWALSDRSVALELLRRVPTVLPLAFGLRRHPHSPATATDACRQELKWLERMGYVYGPIAYGRARLWRRRIGSPAERTGAGDLAGRSIQERQSNAARPGPAAREEAGSRRQSASAH